jgi:hypothetical protein
MMLRNFKPESTEQLGGGDIICTNDKPNIRKCEFPEAESEEKIKSFRSEALAPKSGIANNDANLSRIRFKITESTTSDGLL